MAKRSTIPVSTYRLQLTSDFGFSAASQIVPYLKALGIDGFYASPILAAYSEHGYDVTDPSILNPRLGSEEDFDQLTQTLESAGLGLLVDIVPNHMSARPENPWWRDLLTHGESSRYREFFDLHPDDNSQEPFRIVLPILGRPFGEALEEKEIVPEWDGDDLWV